MKTPVAIIIFNRPDITRRVFAEIARVRPPQLFVIADGPRTNHPEDIDTCAAARAIVDRVDWDCDVLRNYSEINLGCGVRPATGISWVFEHVDKSLILEDDIVPHPTFFRFCEELLERYQDDERIMVISGMKSQFGERGTVYNAYSYGFRRALSCWGWATWRRAWAYFDLEIKLWPKLRDLSWISEITRNARASAFYKTRFDHAFSCRGNVDYWDYQWLFTCWSQNGLCVVPNTNLAINIGFGEQATHTDVPPKGMSSSLEEMVFPLKHPPFVVRDYDGDMHRYALRHPQQQKQREWYNALGTRVLRLMRHRVAGPEL